jgi:hypothetical protein
MLKKQRYGGLTTQHVCLIRDYLHKVYNSPEAWDALNVWIWLLLNSQPTAVGKAKAVGLGKRTVNALKAGLAVLKRRRVGRIWDMNPLQSFSAIGITTTA